VVDNGVLGMTPNDIMTICRPFLPGDIRQYISNNGGHH
jgi:hypothetical protein